MRGTIALLTLFGLAAAPLVADEVIKTGPEFQVNSYTTGPQGFPEIAVGPQGEYVVVWESFGPDGSAWGVSGQRYDAAGQALGGEFQVNTTTLDYQWDPSVAIDGQGNFVVAWQGENGPGAGFDVFLQRFDSAGSPVGGELQVNTFTPGYQGNSSVAANGAGDFLVVWESIAQDLSDGGVYGQLYDSAGQSVGGELRINDTTAADQNDPRVVAVDGGYAVVWESFLQDGSQEATILRFLDSSAAPDGGEMVINSFTIGDQEDPAVAVAADGTLAVVWESDAQDGFGEGVFAQVLDANGSPIGTELQLNTYTADDQENPRVAADGTGGFVAVWSSTGQIDGVSDEVFGRRFDAAGNLVGAEIQVNSQATDDQDLPVVAGGVDGRFMVAWRSFGQPGDAFAGVVAQRFEIGLFADGFESGNTLAWSATSP